MRKYPALLFILPIIVLFAIVSCDPNEPQPPTQAELLASGSWKFQSANYGGTDVSSNPQLACFTDNTLSFAGASYTVTEGTSVCTPSSAGTGTWSIKPTDSLVLSTALVPGTSSGTFKIAALTATTLTLQQNATLVVPPAQLLIVTFKH